MISRAISILLICTLLGLWSSACSSSEREKMVPFGPDVPASLVVYYKAGVTDEQIENFLRDELSKPHPEGRGYYHREGIAGLLRVFPPVQGHEAIAITFSANASQTQREEIKAAVRSSPIVYKVLENVAPADVRKLD